MMIEAEPLTAAAFAPYGQVVQHDRNGVLNVVANAFERDESATTPSLNLLRIEQAVDMPLLVDKLERHPHSSQTFLTLEGGRSLVIVCDSAPDGTALPATLRAFVAEANQGVTYRRNVWHRAVSPLVAPNEYAMTMMRHPAGSDTEIYNIRQLVEVTI